MKTSRGLRQAVLFVTSFAIALPAQAGMTVYGLNDLYRLRLQEISFFLVLLFGCALILKLLWNHAFKGFSSIPRLSYGQAFCGALMFGMLMLLILTMISGIREVLTPGAWRRQGTSYRLNDPAQEPARRRSLEHLRGALFEYARNHVGNFPAHDFGNEISEKLWESPDQAASRYIYSGGLTTNHATSLLAVEPPNFGDRRFALIVSGEIVELSNDEIKQRLQTKSNP